jgi:hypothetical protein
MESAAGLGELFHWRTGTGWLDEFDGGRSAFRLGQKRHPHELKRIKYDDAIPGEG